MQRHPQNLSQTIRKHIHMGTHQNLPQTIRPWNTVTIPYINGY